MRRQLIARDVIPAPYWTTRMVDGDWPRISAAGDVVDDCLQHLLVASQLDRFALQLGRLDDTARHLTAAPVYAERDGFKLVEAVKGKGK